MQEVDKSLRLDGPTLAGIYTGKIRTWDDRAIAALNRSVKLPHNDIIPIRRAEGAGDTFIFTRYLTFSTESWENNYGFGDKVAWPAVPGELEAVGNEGMVDKIKQIPYSIGYVGISSYAGIAKAGIGTAVLKRNSSCRRRKRSRRRLHRSARERQSMSASPWSTRRAQTAIPSSTMNMPLSLPSSRTWRSRRQ
jgi:hypothetical protein